MSHRRQHAEQKKALTKKVDEIAMKEVEEELAELEHHRKRCDQALSEVEEEAIKERLELKVRDLDKFIEHKREQLETLKQEMSSSTKLQQEEKEKEEEEESESEKQQKLSAVSAEYDLMCQESRALEKKLAELKDIRQKIDQKVSSTEEEDAKQALEKNVNRLDEVMQAAEDQLQDLKRKRIDVEEACEQLRTKMAAAFSSNYHHDAERAAREKAAGRRKLQLELATALREKSELQVRVCKLEENLAQVAQHLSEQEDEEVKKRIEQMEKALEQDREVVFHALQIKNEKIEEMRIRLEKLPF